VKPKDTEKLHRVHVTPIQAIPVVEFEIKYEEIKFDAAVGKLQSQFFGSASEVSCVKTISKI
jgi:hypothetical protein